MNPHPPGGERCEQCGRTFASAKGLRQHVRQRHPGVECIVTCQQCGPPAPALAKGLCSPCYSRQRRIPRSCTGCGEVLPHKAGGRCARCHARANPQPAASCSECLAWGPAVGGRCIACREFAAKNSRQRCGVCRRVVPVGRSGRCRLCTIDLMASGTNDGVCSDCGLWAPLIAKGRCNTCVVFRFRSNVGTCSVCGQEMFVGKLGRCRRCLVAGARSGVRYPGRPMTANRESGGQDGAPGVQLFFAGMRVAGRWLAADPVREPRRSADRSPEEPRRGPGPGQLPLLWIRADLARIGLEEAERAARAERPGLLTSVERFGEARGWSQATVCSVQRGVVLLLATRSGEFVVDPAALDHLAARHIPLQPTLDFLSDIGVDVAHDDETMDDWLDDRLSMLSAGIRSEVTSWLDVLRGRSKRRRRSYRPNTVKAYVRVCQLALAEWSVRYGSLRQVTVGDIRDHLDALPIGWDRVNALVGLRSLFGILKANRMVFADPASEVRVSAPPHRALLGVDPAIRRSLLDQVHRRDHQLILLLVGVHALTCQQVADLRLDDVDLVGHRIRIVDTFRPLDELTWRHLVEWLGFRRSRWPRTANPYVLVTTRSANRLAPAGKTYLKGAFASLPVSMSALRIDRLVSEALDSEGDGLRIALLFGLSIETAASYAAVFGPTETAGLAPSPPEPKGSDVRADGRRPVSSSPSILQ